MHGLMMSSTEAHNR